MHFSVSYMYFSEPGISWVRFLLDNVSYKGCGYGGETRGKVVS